MRLNPSNLKEKLPHGSGIEIARRTGLSYLTVHRTINGKSKNYRALRAISDYLSELKEIELNLQN